MSTEDNTIESLADFIQKISKKSSKNNNTFYRGHSDLSYKLEPNIYRKNKEKSLINFEHDMFKEVIIKNPRDFEPLKLNFEKLTLMQHYGLPTRLLDLSENPLIGLYFACSKKFDKRSWKDAELIKFEIPKSLIKYYDSDAVSILSCFSKIDPERFTELNDELKQKIEESTIEKLKSRIRKNQQSAISTMHYYAVSNANDLEKREINEILNSCALLDYMTYEIGEEKPHFRKLINIEHFNNSILCVRPKLNNQRLLHQQGLFLIFGIRDGDKEKLPEFSKSNIQIEKFIIPKEKKRNILEELEIIGITEDKIYPELNMSAEFIAKKYRKRI